MDRYVEANDDLAIIGPDNLLFYSPENGDEPIPPEPPTDPDEN